jgi:exocyst complex component 1
MLLGETDGLSVSTQKGIRPTLLSHKELEEYLGRYGGLLIYLKEMDDSIYAKLCAVGRSYPIHHLIC